MEEVIEQEAAPAEELSVEQIKEKIAAQNKLMMQAQQMLANLREDYLARESMCVSALREARQGLEKYVRDYAKSQDVNLDDGRKWNFDIDNQEFKVQD